MEGFGGAPKKKSLGKVELGLAAAAALASVTAATDAEAQQLNKRPGQVETVGKANNPRVYNRVNQGPAVVSEVVRPDGSVVQVIDGRPQPRNEVSEAERMRQAARERLNPDEDDVIIGDD